METKMEIPRYGLTFAAEGRFDGKQISMTVSSGRAFQHPYWVQLALDFSGMRVPKDRLPILWAHNPDRILGYFDRSAVRANGGLTVTGRLVDTEAAREFSKLVSQGAPFQASLYGSPSEIQRLSDGESEEVNGHVITGEGHIWRKWQLKEAGPAVFGYDQNTEANIFSFAGSNDKLTIDVEMDEDDIIAEHLFSGPKQEEEPLSPEDEALAESLFRSGTGNRNRV